MSLRKNAKELAQRGRYGDDQLIHVSGLEIQGLESLLPEGMDALPRNPDTGLKEAFFFLPFLLGAAAAPAAAAAAAPIAAGLGAAATGAAGLAGLGAAGTVASGVGAGMASGLGALGATTTALPAAAAATLPATALAGDVGAMGAGASGLGALPGSMGAMGSIGAAGPLGAAGAPVAANTAPLIVGTQSAGVTAPLASTPGALGGAAPGAIAMPATPAAVSPISPAATHAAVAAPAKAASAYSGAEGAGTGSSYGVGAPAGWAGTVAPTAPAKAGGLSGLLGGLDSGKMMQGLGLMALMKPMMGQGGSKKEGKSQDVSGIKYNGGDPVFPDENYQGGISPEFDYFPNEHFYKGGGLVQGFAKGGIVGHPPTGQLTGKQGGGAGNNADQKLIQKTIEAIQGKVPDAETVINEFVQTFGQQALQDLIAKLKGGTQAMARSQQGPQSQGLGSLQGDGMSDSIPAQVGGSQPAALSQGEFVMPADVVSGLGNGSTDAGAQQLQGMANRVRQMKTGGVVQPAAMNPRSVMPV